MNKITIDAETRRKLKYLSEPLELCDESGKVLAKLIPQVDLSEYESIEPPISEEELRRREKSDKWYTTKEVLDHLETYEVSGSMGGSRT